ncbi:MAG: NAD-dependent epimerase/dehydratase family protein [Myxococcales bacterium]
MHVIVTGGAGFIGAHTCRALLAKGHRVTAVDDLSHGKREAVPEGAELLVLDVRDPKLMGEMERLRPDAVVHLAAQMDVRKSVADPLWDASINVLGTLSALESARRASVRRFVFASSGGAVYGEQDVFPATESHPRRPASPYGTSKLCGEEYVDHYKRVHGLSTICLRYANVYGPGQDPLGEAGVVAIFLHHLLGGRAPKINGDGLQTRDFVYVEDVARANVLAVESPASGAVNIGTGRESNIIELADILVAATGGSRPTHGPPAAGEQRRSVIDPALAKTTLGWEPRVGFEEGLRRTTDWFRAQAG